MVNPLPMLLDGLQSGLRETTGGTVADYIPELANADPGRFGLALCTLDGHVYGSGDDSLPFTLQSVSKPFVYALALADRGLDYVITRVGVEPSGEAFNAISLEPVTGRPANPMVNAGAILTTSLVGGAHAGERYARIHATLSAFAGRRLGFDEQVYASEFATGNRNRALAHLMHGAGALTAEVDESVALYFRQCAITVTARDLAVMSGTLANAGTNPVTGERVVAPDTAAHVLTVMASCGMYDYSGEWLLRVGLPAKSGVSGGIAAVLPAQFGIGLYSAPLDERGNSVRGIGACEELSARFGLHLMRPPIRTASAVWLSDTLRRDGGTIAVRGLQGDLGFAGAEAVARDIAAVPDLRFLILDLDRVGHAHPVALRILDRLADLLTRQPAPQAVTTVTVDGHRRALLRHAHTEFPTRPEALRWSESALPG